MSIILNFEDDGENVTICGNREGLEALQIQQESRDVGASLRTFSVLAETPRIGDDDWTLQLATQLAIWKTTYEDAQKLQAPDEWRGWNQRYIAVLSRSDRAAGEFASGIDQRNADLIYEAGAEIQQAGQELTVLNNDMPAQVR